MSSISSRALADHSIAELAAVIQADWGSTGRGVYFGAKPYLAAMRSLDSIEDAYGLDSGKSVVLYFLSNANGWRGDTARAVKAELRRRAGVK